MQLLEFSVWKKRYVNAIECLPKCRSRKSEVMQKLKQFFFNLCHSAQYENIFKIQLIVCLKIVWFFFWVKTKRKRKVASEKFIENLSHHLLDKIGIFGHCRWSYDNKSDLFEISTKFWIGRCGFHVGFVKIRLWKSSTKKYNFLWFCSISLILTPPRFTKT